MNILLLTFGNESSIEIVKSLSELNKVNIFGVHTDIKNAGKAYLNKNFIIKINELLPTKESISQINQIILSKNIDYVFVTNCKLIKFIYQNYDLFDKNIIEKFLLPSIQNIKYCLYKNSLYQLLPEISPKIYEKFEDITDDKFFVKPNFGSSGDETQLLESTKSNFDKNTNLISCEYLPGKEYTVDCLADKHGNLIDFNVRERVRTRNGITSYGNSTSNKYDEINFLLKFINKKLKIPYIYFVQFKEDKNEKLKLLEINCRISGSFSITKNSRKDYIKSLIDILNEKEISNIVFGAAKNDDVSIVRHFNSIPINQKQLVVDLDGTLITETFGNYFNAEPLKDNIKITNELYYRGYKIIIHTARGMKRFNNDVNLVYQNLFKLTIKQLKEFDIKYDLLIMGKPYGYYVDEDSLTIDNLRRKLIENK